MVISAENLATLKKLFAEDGIELTHAESLAVGLWLLARIKPVLTSVPLDKMALFVTIRDEEEAIRHKLQFVNLSEWMLHRKNEPLNPSDVPS